MVSTNNSPAKKAKLKHEKEPTSKSQPVMRRKEMSNSNEGLITSISLENFMCHTLITVYFGAKINLIEGQNGSGKSAILTALMIGLGGSATSTNRANKNKSLIKEGESTATITIKINNKADPYKKEIYGDYIIIERKIHNDNNIKSGYKIKSESDKIIHTKKEELMNILDHFGIQNNNKISIMDQETSRLFLRTVDDKEKYNFFMIGTNLTKLNEDNETISKAIDRTEKLIQTKSKILPKFYEECKKIEAKYEVMKKAEKIIKTIKETKHLLAWKQIEEMEIGVNEKEKELEETKQKNTNIEEEKRKIDIRIKELKTKTKNDSLEISEIMENSKTNQKEIESISREKNKQKTVLSNINEDELEINNEIIKLKKEISDFQSYLERDNMASIGGKEHKIKGLEREIEELEVKIKEIGNSITTNNRAVDQKKDDKLKLKEKIHEQEEKVGKNNREVGQIRKIISSLTTQKQNRKLAYGNNIDLVLQDIQTHADKFKTQPIGPFGMHVTLKHSQWADTIEAILGPSLNSFWTSCYSDQLTLSQILSKHRCESNIFVSKVDNFDYSRGEPSDQYLTILRAFEVKDRIVLRQLIVNNKIEKIILIENRKEADKVMANIPNNVIACFTTDGYQVGNKGGGYASMALNKYKGMPRLSQNVDDIIDLNKRKIKEAESNINAISAIIKQYQENLLKIDQEISTIQNNTNELNQEINEKQLLKTNAENEIEKIKGFDNNAYNEAINESKNRIQLLKNQFIALQQKKIETNEQLQTLNRTELRLESTCNINKSKIKELQNEIQESYNKLAIAESELKDISSVDLNDHIQTLSSQLSLDNERLINSINLVKHAFKERTKTQKNSSELVMEIKTLEKQLAITEDNIGYNHIEYKKILLSKKNNLNQAKTDIKLMEEFVEELKMALDNRYIKYNQFMEIIVKRAKKNFIYNLSKRGFSGRLIIDHIKKELETVVKVDNNTQLTNNAPDNKNLSGGEKSYSTICLLLSLWESISSPLRCLDEYDVFMDSANRKTSTKMIIESSNSSSSNIQYILITPLGLEFVKDSPEIKKIKLREPERGQQILDMRQ